MWRKIHNIHQTEPNQRRNHRKQSDAVIQFAWACIVTSYVRVSWIFHDTNNEKRKKKRNRFCRTWNPVARVYVCKIPENQRRITTLFEHNNHFYSTQSHAQAFDAKLIMDENNSDFWHTLSLTHTHMNTQAVYYSKKFYHKMCESSRNTIIIIKYALYRHQATNLMTFNYYNCVRMYACVSMCERVCERACIWHMLQHRQMMIGKVKKYRLQYFRRKFTWTVKYSHIAYTLIFVPLNLLHAFALALENVSCDKSYNPKA